MNPEAFAVFIPILALSIPVAAIIFRGLQKVARLRIEEGMLKLGSLACTGFGATVEPDYAALQPMPKAAWI